MNLKTDGMNNKTQFFSAVLEFEPACFKALKLRVKFLIVAFQFVAIFKDKRIMRPLEIILMQKYYFLFFAFENCTDNVIPIFVGFSCKSQKWECGRRCSY